MPHTSSGATITYDTTQYQYDQVDNNTAVISPRGVASGIANAYTVKTSYDANNRKIASFGAYNPNDAVYKTAPETDYTYDPAGRLTQVTAPPSGGGTTNSVTSTSYWDNGWTKSSTDPSGQAPAWRVLKGVSTAFKWAGRGLAILGVAADIYDVVAAPAGQKVQRAVTDTSALAGAWAGGEAGAIGGAEIGAVIGTFVGPEGTVVGGVVGGIVGGIGGAIVGRIAGTSLGRKISSWF